MSSSSLQLKPLLEIFDGDRAAVAELLDEAVGYVSTAYDDIVRALAIRDVQAVKARAHAIKGCAGNVGAHELSRIAASIEENAKNNHLEIVDVTIHKLLTSVDVLKSDVDNFKKGQLTNF